MISCSVMADRELNPEESVLRAPAKMDATKRPGTPGKSCRLSITNSGTNWKQSLCGLHPNEPSAEHLTRPLVVVLTSEVAWHDWALLCMTGPHLCYIFKRRQAKVWAQLYCGFLSITSTVILGHQALCYWELTGIDGAITHYPGRYCGGYWARQG